MLSRADFTCSLATCMPRSSFSLPSVLQRSWVTYFLFFFKCVSEALVLSQAFQYTQTLNSQDSCASASCPPDFSHVLPTVQIQCSSLCSHFTQPQLRKMLKLNQSSFLRCSNTKSCSATPERGGGVGTASPRRNKLLN